MKRRIITLLMCVILIIICSGCSSDITYKEAQDIQPEEKTFAEGYFTVIKEWGEGNISYKIVYANDTKVKYFVIFSNHKGNVTPLYNADGTLQIHKEDNSNG